MVHGELKLRLGILSLLGSLAKLLLLLSLLPEHLVGLIKLALVSDLDVEEFLLSVVIVKLKFLLILLIELHLHPSDLLIVSLELFFSS